ncbi:MAG: BNR-4 repeat-containing protein [Thermoleophilaceae bacterium]
MRVCSQIWLALGAFALVATASANAAAPQQPLGDGAWCWFADPRGVHYEGTRNATYIGWVAQDGDIKVASFDHFSGVRTTAVLHSKLQVDDHSNPALLVRPDGRLQVFYSGHNGRSMYYRVTTNPEDVGSWGAEAKLPTNTSGPYGFTYPNPMRLSAEQKTYLFWRGGNYNPTFSTQQDGQSSWAPAQTLVSVPGQRPYVKYDSNKTDKIGFAFTNGHPDAVSSNIYFAYYKAGGIYKADGTRIGTLGTAITPAQADKVFDNANKVWVHDMAFDSQGRPVIVFAEFVSTSDHRYWYAKWLGDRWATTEITHAGGSIDLDGTQPYYSAGITLDHEDPSTVYLSRDAGGVFEVETWTTPDDGTSWSRTEITAASSTNNVRPISPRGLIPFSGAMSVVWMGGTYTSYVAYKTSITAVSANGGSKSPIADAEWTPHGGPAPQAVSFDGRGSSDPDGSVSGWSWSFGDGSTGSGSVVSHTYTQAGRYFPRLTVTDNSGSKDVFVGEVVVDPRSAPAVSTGGATGVGSTSATLNGSINPKNQATSYRFQYGRTTAYESATPERTLPSTGNASQAVSAAVSGLTPGATYHYRLVATNATGTSAGVDRTFTASTTAPSRYRDTVLATAGRAGYWRLGETSGTAAADETAASPGSYLGGYLLDQVGALVGDPNSSVRFDGVGGEMSTAGPALAASGSLEGWFDWRGGVAVMRDGTSAGGAGWILAYDSNGSLLYRLGGKSFNTGRTTASVQSGWHHFVVTKDGGNVAFYLDGQLVHSGTGAPATAPTTPWHVMRNGGYAQFAQGGADEVAVYNVPLSAATVQQHYNAGKGL